MQIMLEAVGSWRARRAAEAADAVASAAACCFG